MYDATQILLLLLLGAVAYLIVKVNRLEQLVRDGGKARRRLAEPAGEGKVISILKENIEPGPFKDGNRRPPEE